MAALRLSRAVAIATPSVLSSLRHFGSAAAAAGPSTSAMGVRVLSICSAVGSRSMDAAGSFASRGMLAQCRRSPAVFQAMRGWASKVVPEFAGGKIKPYSAYKGRFQQLASGAIKFRRPGRVHKRFNKSRRQLRDLAEPRSVPHAFARTMKKLGFVSR